ncbi:alpha/beta fold hydrolase [Pseudobacillus wudalianchiensis]|uniref:AB hydrolase-1 domain-containing protein n=1 Tax=Pseudobacillus wudalianchiensis TaxID=1743143 RepID=A0A1B9B6V5_9BACI|nr:alpha/beta hydrolase [Bacillus wudalianchiensis]OCA91789.1 hypothetical protein A8F95_19680 [Bacillus wudalianchiensis]
MESEAFKTLEGETSFYKAYDNSMSLWDVPFESNFIETEYGRTHFVTAGPETGKPLILLHGFGFGAPMWYPNVKLLSKDHRVYALDVIGEFNKSVIYKSIREKDDYALWLCEFLDCLEISKATFIGHSNGGWHTLNFALYAPERVEKIVLLAPAASFIPFSKQFGIRLIAINVIKSKSFINNFFAKWLVANGNFVHDNLFEHFYQGLLHFQWKHKILIPSVFTEKELSRLAVPGLFIVGDKEVIYNPYKALEKVHSILPHMRTKLVSNASHALSIEKAQVVNEEILAFIT